MGDAEKMLLQVALQTFDKPYRQDHLRLHHAVYLHPLLGENADGKDERLNSWARNALSRFFDVLDPVAIMLSQSDPWAKSSKIIRRLGTFVFVREPKVDTR